MVRLALVASLLRVALRRSDQLPGGDASTFRVTQTGSKEIVNQSCHGTAQAPAFTTQRADDDPVNAG